MNQDVTKIRIQRAIDGEGGESPFGSTRVNRTGGNSAPDPFWISLSYFNYYRLAVATLFLLVVLIYGDLLSVGSHRPRVFLLTCASYFSVAVLFQAVMRKWPRQFEAQLTMHVIADIVALVVMMNASGGFRSGIGVMLLISLAGAALVSRGSLMLFYAAIASIALLIEQSYWILVYDVGTANYLQPGLLSIGYFATALITNQLAQRVIMNERVARQRGTELANQLRINQLAIRDMQDGILVVDSNDLVRQHNPVVDRLLGQAAPELDQIEAYSTELAQAFRAWKREEGPSIVTVLLSRPGRQVRARFIPAGVEGEQYTLVFLEDLSRMQERAQQLKLAALGRLTASIAHEIRNPLSAITHAGGLLAEEVRGGPEIRLRLLRIIRDNAERLDRMVRDILELSRRDRAQMQSIDLCVFMHQFVEEFSRNERVPVGAVRIGIPDPICVDFDPVHLNQVLWNLVRNAWRHGSKGVDSVRIVAEHFPERIELHVIDDGPGVRSELRPQLFEPFFTTESSGTGLGIFIARELCVANGARLEYVDGGSGADFRISWRAAQ